VWCAHDFSRLFESCCKKTPPGIGRSGGSALGGRARAEGILRDVRAIDYDTRFSPRSWPSTIANSHYVKGGTYRKSHPLSAVRTEFGKVAVAPGPPPSAPARAGDEPRG
jgi:hypothetical protein